MKHFLLFCVYVKKSLEIVLHTEYPLFQAFSLPLHKVPVSWRTGRNEHSSGQH